MSRSIKTSFQPAKDIVQDAAADTLPPEVASLLDRVDELLQAGKPEKALEAVHRSKLRSPWAVNASAVCLLRMGDAKAAVVPLRTLVMARDVVFRTDVPAVFKTNLAAAMLLGGNYWGCLSALADVGDEQNPAVARLRGAIRRWKEGFSFLQKVRHWFGTVPDTKIELDFPPGDLYPSPTSQAQTAVD